MKVTYYRSAFCPRCWLADRRMSELRAARPAVEIETVDVLVAPARAMRAGVWMLPTIVIGARRWHHAPPLAVLEAALLEDEQNNIAGRTPASAGAPPN